MGAKMAMANRPKIPPPSSLSPPIPIIAPHLAIKAKKAMAVAIVAAMV